MPITDEEVFLLNKKMGSVARKVQLGTLIRNAENLAVGGAEAVAPVASIIFTGEFTTVGGDTDETIPIAGLLATDIVMATIKTAGAVPVTIEDVTASAGQIDLDMSADPSNDHVISYQVSRLTS